MASAKPFEISKWVVWEAYRHVKGQGGGPGVDRETMEDFECDLKGNLYRIWNRMSSGTYFPPPVLQVAIAKPDGGERKLGIPTISDRIAQTVAKTYLEPLVEPSFHPDSYAYRPDKSALHALAKTRERCWRYDWVLDLDIRRFFDTLDHGLVMRAVRKYTSCRWILLYIERWLKAPIQVGDGSLMERESGTPQGGVVSPLLANLFLHLAFDTWMRETHAEVPFERYADDIVVHCKTLPQAKQVLKQVKRRLGRCRLELHATKTKIVYCKDSNRRENYSEQSFDFLGYTFRPRRARNHRGEYFVSFSPAVSRRAAKRMRQTMRRQWRLRLRTDLNLNDLARRFDPVLRGWIAYYGAYHRSELYSVFRSLDLALAKWAMRKYKRLRGHRRRARRWLARIAQREPTLFAHWQLARSQMAGR